MTSSYSKTSVCVRPHVNEKPAFFKISTLGTVFKRTPFAGGRQTKTEKKISCFTKYPDTCGRGLILSVILR